MKFQVIITDNPWHFNSRKSGGEVKNKTKFGGGCEKHYSLLKDEDLFDLKPYINDISDDNCAMFMWCVSSKLDVAINMMEHWGFKYKTMPFVWVKTYPKSGELCMNPGFYVANNVETIILGVKQKTPKFFEPEIKMQQQVILHERLRHSQKPEIFQDRIDNMYPKYDKLEMFARRQRDGWTCIGNEITGNDIRKDLQLLKDL